MEPNYLDGNFMGVGWQCVEFARRWLYENKGLTFPSIRNAADIWPDVDALLPVGGGRPVTLTAHPNGDSTAPAKDDLLLYAETFLGTGHVAIITEVDLEQGWVRVAEQNFDNRPWIGSYARQIPLRTEHGMYWLEGEDVIGWKHIPPAGE